MTISPEKNVRVILNSLNRIKNELNFIVFNLELNTYFLVQKIKVINTMISTATSNYQELANSGMSNSEISRAFADLVYPAPTPGSTFVSINQAKNSFIASYENDVWPLFQGKTVDLVSGNHIDVDIVKPAAFETATQNFLNAISALIKVN